MHGMQDLTFTRNDAHVRSHKCTHVDFQTCACAQRFSAASKTTKARTGTVRGGGGDLGGFAGRSHCVVLAALLLAFRNAAQCLFLGVIRTHTCSFARLHAFMHIHTFTNEKCINTQERTRALTNTQTRTIQVIARPR
jgi:hypothetical protein